MCNRLSFSWPMATALMPFTCTICTVGLIIHRRGERSRGLFSLSVFSVSHLIHLSVSFFSYCKGAHSLIVFCLLAHYPYKCLCNDSVSFSLVR